MYRLDLGDGKLQGNLRKWPKVREWWCGQLAFEGEEVKDEEGRIVKRGMDAEVLAQLVKSGKHLSMAQVLSCCIRYLVDGGVIGSREFVRRIVNAERGRRLPANRKSEGSRTGMGGLFSLRKVG